MQGIYLLYDYLVMWLLCVITRAYYSVHVSAVMKTVNLSRDRVRPGIETVITLCAKASGAFGKNRGRSAMSGEDRVLSAYRKSSSIH